MVDFEQATQITTKGQGNLACQQYEPSHSLGFQIEAMEDSPWCSSLGSIVPCESPFCRSQNQNSTN